MKYLLASSLLACVSAVSAVEPPCCKTATKPISTVVREEAPSIVKIAAGAGQFRTLLSALIATDLLGALEGDGPFTVLAPTDEAFAKLPKGTLETLLKPENREQLATILKYHVIPKKASFNPNGAEGTYRYKTLEGREVTVVKDGHGLKVNGANIVKTNIKARNGSVQIIDAVLLPPSEKATTMTIPGVAEKAGMFKTLLAAVKTAELAEVLSGPGPFTVFAPTDEAFAKLPKGTVETLLKPENREQLVKILKLHVVAGKVTAQVLAAKPTAVTLSGAVAVSIQDGRINVNNSNVIKSDIMAENGIIHVIDAVLLPGR
jgi:transforming growth factor-beta-induced protein